MTKLDRDLQRLLLQKLGDAYPNFCEPAKLGFDASNADWNVNILYLEEHGLVEAKSSVLFGDSGTRVHLAKATARGLDFLQDDGGLGAILNVMTVRFDADTLKAIIGDHIEASALPAPEKSRLMSWLRSAGSSALKEATTRLVGAALDHAPEALQLLQTLPG